MPKGLVTMSAKEIDRGELIHHLTATLPVLLKSGAVSAS
jgi:hypothetical protein